MPEFHETRAGAIYYGKTMPRIAEMLEVIAERLAPLKELQPQPSVGRFDPQSAAEQDGTLGEGMLARALTHAERGLREPQYARHSLEAIVYYLEQMVDRNGDER